MGRAATGRLAGKAGTLEELEFHWGSAYDAANTGAVLTAKRRAGRGTRLADLSPEGLLQRIRADYPALPVQRDLP